MKTVLTLKYSSFLFCNKLALVKNTPKEVETDIFSDKDITLLNTYIKSGSVLSSNGSIPERSVVTEVVETPVTIEPIIEVKTSEPEITEDVEDEQPVRSTLDVLDAPAVEEVKKVTPKKTVAKKVAK